jgi:hypothetical protein
MSAKPLPESADNYHAATTGDACCEVNKPEGTSRNTVGSETARIRFSIAIRSDQGKPFAFGSGKIGLKVGNRVVGGLYSKYPLG